MDNIFPNQPYRCSGYASWENTLAKTGDDAQPYHDHDQLNTISRGASYQTMNGKF